MARKKDNFDLHSIKLETGTVYQTEKGGTYYFRYQVNKERKCVSLRTRNQEEALKKAKELLPVIKSDNLEVISTHVKVAKNLAQKQRSLPVKMIWEVYSNHPDKATPATVHEELSYQATLQEFLFQLDPRITQFAQITADHAVKYASFLKQKDLSVSTHNRKIIRLRKIFSTLQSYRAEENPFAAPSLRRKPREEQDNMVRRIPFTREEEERLRQLLDDPAYKIMNKEELKTVFYVGMYTGQRMKDCVLARWDQVDLENRRIFVKQFKTGKEVSIPLAAPLWKLLTEVKAQELSPVYISPNVAERYRKKDARGKVVGDNYINLDIMRVIKWLGLPTSVEIPGRKRKVTVRGFHSLRHSFCTHCAEAGVAKAVVQSILGAESSILDRIYTHIGTEAQMAAIEAVSGTASSTPRARIKRALEYIASIPEPSAELLAIEKILKN